MVCKLVCVLMLHGLFVSAYPTDDYGDPCLVEVDGVAQFATLVPATGSVSILGQLSCPLLVLNPPTPLVLGSYDIIEFSNNDDEPPYAMYSDENYEPPYAMYSDENDEPPYAMYSDENDEPPHAMYSDESDEPPYAMCDENDELPCSIYDENDTSNYSDKEIPKDVILGALLAGAITAVKGAEIDATLAEIDAFVDAELDKIETLIDSSVANLDTLVECELTGIDSQIGAELETIDELVDLELTNTENLVEDVVDNLETTECQNNSDDTYITHMETANVAEKKGVVKLELSILSILESFVDSLLAKTESVVDDELNKVNGFVESELAKVDEIVKTELDKVDLFAESELAKTDALIKSELAKVDSFVEEELARVRMSVKAIVFNGVVPTIETAKISGCDCEPELPEDVYDDNVTDDDNVTVDDNITVDDNVKDNDNVCDAPVVGESGVTPAVGGFRITRVFPCDNLIPLPNRDRVITPMPMGGVRNNVQNGESGPVTSRMRILPAVNLLKNLKCDDLDLSALNIDGVAEFSGTTRATGNMRLFNQFPCPPLLPTQVGPDGKKYIWIAPSKPSKEPPKPCLPIPEELEAIQDSSKNFETNED